MKTIYQIQQATDYQYEPVPEGDFDTLAEAKSAMHELESNLGWRDLRIVERIESETTTEDGDVVLEGLPA